MTEKKRRGRPKKAVPQPPKTEQKQQQQQQKSSAVDAVELNDLELACLQAAAQMQEQINKRMSVYFQKEMRQIDEWMAKAHNSLKARGIEVSTDDRFDGEKIIKRV